MPTFAEIKDLADDKSFVHRHLQGVAFMADLDATLPEALMSSDTELAAIPTAFWPVGIVSTSGFVFSEDVTKDEIEAWGYSDPARTDIIKAPKQVQFTPFAKHKRKMLELLYSMDLSGVTPTANGEIVFDEVDLPEPVERRLLVISFDGRTDRPFIRGKGLAAVKLAEKGDEAWNADADSAGQDVTLDILQGAEGFAVRHYFGGKAFDVTKHGFAA